MLGQAVWRANAAQDANRGRGPAIIGVIVDRGALDGVWEKALTAEKAATPDTLIIGRHREYCQRIAADGA